jgi:hypothetical protein
MTTSTKVRMLVPSIAVPALVGAAVALVAQSVSTASVPVCIKNNGQVRVLMGEGATCDASEVRTNWVIGGEVTDITLGQGLVGTREGGTVQLAVDPSLLEACNGGCRGGRIFSGFNDGPVALPVGFPQEIARLDLPAGNFTILAKMTVTNTLDEGFDDRVLCTLRAEADFDQGELVLSEDVRTVILHPYNAAAGLTMQVAHHFSAPGSAILTCYEQDAQPDLSYQDLKVTAVEGSSISKVFLGAQ